MTTALIRQKSLLILHPLDHGIDSLISQVLADTTQSIDVLYTNEFTEVKELERFLAAIYNSLREQASALGRESVSTRVMYNDNFKFLKQTDKQWDVIFIDNRQMENPDVKDCVAQLELTEEIPIMYLFPVASEPPSWDNNTVADEEKELESAQEQISQDLSSGSYPVTACGGSFDHLHDGHKILLTVSAFLASTKLIVGVTGEKLLENKKYKELLEDYDRRVQQVEKFVNFISPRLQLDTYEINDVAGPTAYIEDIDALVLSLETAEGGKTINDLRKEKGFHELKIYTIDVIGGGSKEDNWSGKLSSTKLRELEYVKKTKPQ